MSRGGHRASEGSPYAPQSSPDTDAMLDAIGVGDVDALFDIPPELEFDGDFGIEARSEQAVTQEVDAILEKNDDVIEFLGRGHYDHYVPAVVDQLSSRSEFITSYTQYQPEVAQGFLQALFEYQSLVVELTGLPVANCSMYDAATALGEAALLADRVRETDGDEILVPETLRSERRSVLENYVDGAGLRIESYPVEDGATAVDKLRDRATADTVCIYAESPTTRGVIEENLGTVGNIADDAGALFCMGSDLVALSLLERPADVGADVVVGDAALGLPTSYGMGLGIFATREDFLRQVPGRLVGAGEDAAGDRAYTLTLQTREQHIRRERATSNICTNQAWLALRAAIHALHLGPSGLAELARDCVQYPRRLAAELDDLAGITAPVHDRHHFREFVARTDRPAEAVQAALLDRGIAVHAVGEHELQICVTETTAEETDRLCEALEEVSVDG